MTERKTLPQMILEVLSDGRPRTTRRIREAIMERFNEYHNDASISARTRKELRDQLDDRRAGKEKEWTIKANCDESGQVRMAV